LSDVLSLVTPLAFGQSTRIRATVDGILKRFQVENSWQLEIAAMLSGLGCVTLPAELLEKQLAGAKLSNEESRMFAGHPAIASELIRSIPRLGRVADIIACQNSLASSKTIEGREIPFESRILKLATDFDVLELNSESSLHALADLNKESDLYGSELLEALRDYVKTERDLQFAELMLDEIRVGMILAQDIKNSNGTLLMSKGQEISLSACRLLENVSKNKGIEEPIKVVVSNSLSRP
jgi:hypothetical protein